MEGLGGCHPAAHAGAATAGEPPFTVPAATLAAARGKEPGLPSAPSGGQAGQPPTTPSSPLLYLPLQFTKKQRAESAEALLQWVPAEQLPAAYGGRCSVPLSESQLEREMLDFVRRLNREQPQQQAGGEEPGGETGAETAAGGESTAADEALGSKLS